MSVYTFQPILQERIWGGRILAEFFNRPLPEGKKIGESWELVDRPEANSLLVTPEGEITTLHALWKKDRARIFGSHSPETPHFPILIKLLDCAETLSVQVHPPAAKAKELNGEPKTEMWYFLHTQENAFIYAGLKRGVTREAFEKAIGTPQLADLLQKLPTQAEQAMFLPSGRVHAIGAGNLILEVQQNSDTTYRVDDWGRVDSTGKPRELHIAQSLQSIQFDDIEPFFVQPHSERILTCPYFSVRRALLYPDEYRAWTGDGTSFQWHFVAFGEATMEGRTFKLGESWLVSADHPRYEIKPSKEGAILLTVLLGEP